MSVAQERSATARTSLNITIVETPTYPHLAAFDLAIYTAGFFACLSLLGFASIKPFSILAIGGDNIATWNYAKSYIDGFGFRINPNLGFPGVMDNAYFPSFDFSYRAFLRAIGIFVNNAATSYYLMYLVGTSAMFAASVYALKSLGFKTWLSVIGAVVYVVSPYFAFRSLVHDFLALYYAAPLGAALALRIGFAGKYMRSPRLRETSVLLSLAVISTSGLYYAFFSSLFLAFTATTAAISRSTIRPLMIAFIIIAAIFPILVITGFGSGLYDVLSGTTPTVKRVAADQLVFGLNLAEATHLFRGIAPLKWAHDQYLSVAPRVQTVLGLEDWPGIFLTVIIFASPLLVASIASLSHRSRWHALIFMSSACIVFGIIYATNGGLSYYFNLFVNPSIRATGRIIPFLSFFAVVITLAVTELLAEKPGYRSVACRGAVLLLFVASMIPSIGSLSFRQRSIASARGDNEYSARQVLAAKDGSGITTVLQLPHLPWPELGTIRGFDPYSLQNYYIFDRKRSPTKWSYGGSPQQPGFILVARAVEDHKASGLVAAAKNIGFDGALLEKQPYEDAEWRALADNLSQGACKVFEDHRRILFAFKECSDAPS